MRIHARHAGGHLPFERDRRLVLRHLPAGAVVRRAVLTLTPVSTDPTSRFLETLTFAPGTVAGDWGATKVVTAGAVEVNLHARRRLASLAGTGLGGTAPLLVDLGGGFLGVDDTGAFGSGSAFGLADTADLPGLVVTGIRVPRGGSDLSVLRVSSPPSNVTLAIEGGPVFFAHLGELVGPTSTPDFADVLGAMLPDLAVENGYHVVPFLVRSDSIARLDVELVVEAEVMVPAAPAGLRTVQAAYRYDGAPPAAAARLAVRVPPGMVAVEGATTGRVQGAFAATRVVHGAVTAALPPELVPVEAGRALAQPFVTATTEVVTAVDLLLTAVTAEVSLAVDIVGDLDGKPGRASLLSRPAELTLTRDTAGSPTWVSVPLRGEVEVTAGRRQWLVVQARAGAAAWSAGAPPAAEGDAGPGPALQQTRDGALSWRAVPAGTPPVPGPGLAASLRLRHATTGFHLPLELRVGVGQTEVAVSLQRFAPAGEIDFALDFPEVARALNTAVSAAGAVSGGGERIANGDFADWYRVGTTLRPAATLLSGQDGGSTLATTVFSADGARVLALGRAADPPDAEGGPAMARLVAFDVLTRARVLDTVIGAGVPHAVALDPTGRRLVVATMPEAVFSPESGRGPAGSLMLVDAATGRRTGAPVPVPEGTPLLAPAADGRGVVLAGSDRAGQDVRTVVRHVDWADLSAASGGAPLDWDALPHDSLPGLPLALSTGPDGRIALLAATHDGGEISDVGVRLVTYASRSALAARTAREVEVPPASRGVVCPAGAHLLVLAGDRVRYVRAADLTTGEEVPLGDDAAGQAVALDPAGELAVVARRDDVVVLDVARRRLQTPPAGGVPLGEGVVQVSVSPAGTHAAVSRADADEVRLLTIGEALPAEWELTEGQVRPEGLEATGEVFAVLGRIGKGRSAQDVAQPGRRRAAGAVEPAAMSQVVPVIGGARYRFGFDGVALVEGASAQVRWRGDDCAPGRVDRVPVAVFDPEVDLALDTIPRHDSLLVAPVGASQAEVRFSTPEGLLLVDRVTLTGSDDVSGPAWVAGGPGVTVAGTGRDVVLSNGGPTPSAVTQVVAATAGDRFELAVRAATSGEAGAVVELEFADEAGGTVGPLVRVPLEALDLDLRAASGEVPAEAVEATLRVALPAGAVVVLTGLTLTMGPTTDVGLYFASEAPGDLSLTDVTVTLDEGEPADVPVPSTGLCRPTPSGTGDDGAECYCQACGQHAPATRGRAVRTDAGRPALLTPCPACGMTRVRTGGRPVPRAGRVDLPRFRAVDRPVGRGQQVDGRGSRGPALVSRVVVDVPITDIAFVGDARAAQLRAIGIRDVVELARADVGRVAALPAVSDRMARQMIAAAAELVRTRGRRVVLDR